MERCSLDVHQPIYRYKFNRTKRDATKSINVGSEIEVAARFMYIRSACTHAARMRTKERERGHARRSILLTLLSRIL